METRTCALDTCEQNNPQPLSNFHNKGDGKSKVCKFCTNKRQRAYKSKPSAKDRRKAYYRENPDVARKAWERSLKRKYGITADQYHQMLAEQGEVCAICKTPPANRKLVVDHCHQTGAVRGLLCNHCNSMLGFSRDKLAVLVALNEYLVRHNI